MLQSAREKNMNIRYKNKLSFLITTIFLIGHIVFNVKADKANATNKEEINKLIQNGGYIATKENTCILSYNPDKSFIPASIWKIVTALGALETLGEKYRFKTECYLDNSNNLYIKGYGDPFLISEEIDSIFKALAERGIVEINNIYLDSTSFTGTKAPPGVSSSLNPYDVTNSALAVNFNTINFHVDGKGTISSAEKQTPTLNIMKELGRNFNTGNHRINISGSPENVSRYTGELFRSFQRQHGIPGRGTEISKETPSDLKPFYIYYSSRTLEDIIKAMMLYSNNYIANQIYLTLGATEDSYPATWEKSRVFLRKYLDKTFPEHSKSIVFDEGSGISRNNMINAHAMIEALNRFKPYAHLLPLENGKLIKSGTLKGVYSYAGYFVRGRNYDSFVIILNQKKNNRDKILGLMEQQYNEPP